MNYPLMNPKQFTSDRTSLHFLEIITKTDHSMSITLLVQRIEGTFQKCMHSFLKISQHLKTSKHENDSDCLEKNLNTTNSKFVHCPLCLSCFNEDSTTDT